MFPQRELTELAEARERLHRRIAARRITCVVTAGKVAAPLALIDRAWAIWRRLAPVVKLAAVPLAVLLGRKLAPKATVVGTLLRWAPAVWASMRGRG